MKSDPSPIQARYGWLAIFGLTAVAALTACGGESEPGPEEMQMPPTPVSVARVINADLAQWERFSGRIEAVESIELRPRVGGYLLGVHFEEGGRVAAGDLLFTIDDREYRAALATAEADVVRAQSRLQVAELELARSEELVAARAVSQGELDTRLGERDQARADLAAAQARVDQAALNVEFTRVAAPIDGRIGAALVKPGNLLSPNTTLLSTLVSIDPVYVSFEANERAFLNLRGNAETNGEVPVEIALVNETDFPHQGALQFVDNALDPASGTIRLRALLDNPDERFTPGLFARLQIPTSDIAPRLLVHDQAVITDQDRKYVYVVGEGETAQRREVELGEQIDGLRAITAGLNGDERVVVAGMKRIFFPGAPLAANEVPMRTPLVDTVEGAAGQ
ncbi:MAG: efflux RND transporter periplasmic adaptor subunit [Pseudomonadota bacterium]